MKKIFFIFYFFLISFLIFDCNQVADAAEISSQEQLQQGIQAYQQNEFEKALNIFKTLNQTINSAGLFGYIGNCYIKMNRKDSSFLGQGIAAYLSALKREPNNPDLRHNLQYALSQTEDQISFTALFQGDGLRGVFLTLVRMANVSTHYFIFLVLFFLLLLLCLWYGIYKNALALGRLWIFLLSLALIFQGTALFIRASDMEQKQGVLTVPVAEVRYGPSQADTKAFLLHLGSPFEIHHTNKAAGAEGTWTQIRLRDKAAGTNGKVGWLPSETFVEVK